MQISLVDEGRTCTRRDVIADVAVAGKTPSLEEDAALLHGTHALEKLPVLLQEHPSDPSAAEDAVAAATRKTSPLQDLELGCRRQ